MKAMFCRKCGTIRSLETYWIRCECGICCARWTDPQKGTAEVIAAKDMGRDYVRIIGFNNRFLMADAWGAEWRKTHEDATNAPGYLFDKSSRNCWAVVIRIGESNDVNWHELQPKIDSGELSFHEAVLKI